MQQPQATQNPRFTVIPPLPDAAQTDAQASISSHLLQGTWKHADPPRMVGPVSGGSFAAMAAGVRSELKAITLRETLGDAGLLDANLAGALDSLEDASSSLTRAGLAAMEAETVGTLIDVLG